jgi:hypothetical protein
MSARVPSTLVRVAALGVLALVLLLQPAGASAEPSACHLGPGGSIRHVIILQFDNVHLRRDNPNVPSDIEQMPALDNFMKGNGALLSNDHTALISHTADGITSTETGLYPGDEGLGVSNSFEYYVPYGSGTANKSAFTYWTDPISSTDTNFEMLDQSGQNTPAPWVPFTRAGCDFAGIGSANMEFENDTSDVQNVFGAGSSQAAMGNWSYNTAYGQHFSAGSNLGATDFEGLAIHCSLADSQPGGRCDSANGGAPDVLPDEPNSYSGYNALFGALSVNPLLTGQPDQPLPANYTPAGDTAPPTGNWLAPPVYDVFAPNADNSGSRAAPDPGNVGATDSPPPSTFTPGSTPTTQILDWTLNPGFPGFDGMEANNALGYTAAAQEAGIPVTYTYLSDVHDDQYYVNHGYAFGPGEAGMEAQLHEYNAAFEAFFHRLAEDGINRSNTLFVVTVDEGDHFDGGPPLNPGCNGVTTPCQYTASDGSRNVGEVDVNLPQLISSTTGDTTHFGFDFDDAPAILVPNQTDPTAAPPAQTDPTVRNLERELAGTKEFNPINGQTVPITVQMADQSEEQILHMINDDPLRTPTFTLFGDPSFYFQASCTAPGPGGCPTQGPDYAWNHGDIQPEIATTWQGWVGPGVRHVGQTDRYWTDHTDVRPTLLSLLRLRDDYVGDGASIAPIMTATGMPRTIRLGQSAYDSLDAAYKQLDAPFGSFGMSTLQADTTGIESNAGGDSTYTGMDAQLNACETARSALAGQIESVLNRADDGLSPVGAGQAIALVRRADALIRDARSLASDSTPPARTVCG